MAKRVAGRRARGWAWRARLVGTCPEHPRPRMKPDRVVWSYYPAPIQCWPDEVRHAVRADAGDDGNGGSSCAR
jgi:hypothetical protein